MDGKVPKELGLIAGRGVYPLLLAESALKQGVERICVTAFHKETDPSIKCFASEISWVHVGQLGHMLDSMHKSGIEHAVMAGQITPTSLFLARPDVKMFEVLKRLKTRNAETIFGAVGDELRNIGIHLIPASAFMEDHMPGAGLLSKRSPTESEQQDIELGLEVARATSGLDIGQTVVIKEGTILAVEAFEGTDVAITRAGKLGGEGIVVVKVAKRGHDMRFDIPVIGMRTMKTLAKAKATAIAVEAGRCILLEREQVIDRINRMNMAMLAVDTEKVFENV
ncbi:MAG: UDP-2,3-diacylglucosamine diphosphatase LpxI [Kiritimatiellia bacterium]|jgi:hypothetical protein|nr:UDP-2,3-diacylglucosamine diphosphatase LpxI [Kiritimatiellia bacterium]